MSISHNVRARVRAREALELVTFLTQGAEDGMPNLDHLRPV